ncbi:MAG: alpha/beta hydrolase family protein [Bryobacteraceae bacterium]
MKRLFPLFTLCATLSAQTTVLQVERLLEPALQTPEVVAYQLREYLDRKAPPLAAPSSAAQWSADGKRIRRHVLDDVVFHGWPREWIDAPLKAEDLGTIPSGSGYRIHKIRYEIVPGFEAVAILYEPERIEGTMPAILNVNGHVGAPGKSVEYKQKRCINFARNGIIALNLEWFSYGELGNAENSHSFGAHLDLVGANGVGLFYLAMRKGLDYLDQHPNVDRSRLGVTGLSGGGWQTIILSALDERVAVSVPVASYSSLRSRLERSGDTGDIEQNATDLLVGQDYSHLTAMRAPRPTLLIYNTEDDCCFRAPLVKPYVFDAIRPFFNLYGKTENLAWHENLDPATHNYQLDNRLQAYRFFSHHFRLPEITNEAGVDSEVKSYDELIVGLPTANLTILGLARKLAAENRRGSGNRERLREIVRYKDVRTRPWALTNTKNKGLETYSGRFDFSNGLSATAVWLKVTNTAPVKEVTIILDDKGKKASAALASERINRGESILVADLLFTGDSVPQHGSSAFTQLLATTGDRPLGLEAAQLIALVAQARVMTGAQSFRLETNGFRSKVIALVATALKPGLFREVVLHEGHASLRYLLDEPIEYQNAPDLFCLDLYKEFDLDRLAELSAPTSIRQQTSRRNGRGLE